MGAAHYGDADVLKGRSKVRTRLHAMKLVGLGDKWIYYWVTFSSRYYFWVEGV
jgi:hypothetical protein